VFQAGFRNPPKDQILIDRGAEVAVRIALGQVSDEEHLVRGDIPHLQFDVRGGVAWLFLLDHIGPLPHLIQRLLLGAVFIAVSIATIHSDDRALGRSRHEKRDWLILMLEQLDRSLVWAGMTQRNIGLLPRSEERRVGKECRSGWARYHGKSK